MAKIIEDPAPWAGMKAAGNPIWFEAEELLGEIKAKAEKEA